MIRACNGAQRTACLLLCLLLWLLWLLFCPWMSHSGWQGWSRQHTVWLQTRRRRVRQTSSRPAMKPARQLHRKRCCPKRRVLRPLSLQQTHYPLRGWQYIPCQQVLQIHRSRGPPTLLPSRQLSVRQTRRGLNAQRCSPHQLVLQIHRSCCDPMQPKNRQI